MRLVDSAHVAIRRRTLHSHSPLAPYLAPSTRRSRAVVRGGAECVGYVAGFKRLSAPSASEHFMWAEFTVTRKPKDKTGDNFLFFFLLGERSFYDSVRMATSMAHTDVYHPGRTHASMPVSSLHTAAHAARGSVASERPSASAASCVTTSYHSYQVARMPAALPTCSFSFLSSPPAFNSSRRHARCLCSSALPRHLDTCSALHCVALTSLTLPER